MYQFSRKIALALALLVPSALQAATITTAVNVDNAFTAYISTDNSVAGTQFSSGSNWPSAINGSATLTDGITNYLHIRAQDLGGIAMMLGTFTLSDATFSFANGTQSLLTGDAGLLVSTTGWQGYQSTRNLGPNGTGPWGTRGPSADADYVWSNNPWNDNTVYFTAEISYDVTPVPLPASLPMMAFGLGTIGVWRLGRKNKILQ